MPKFAIDIIACVTAYVEAPDEAAALRLAAEMQHQEIGINEEDFSPVGTLYPKGSEAFKWPAITLEDVREEDEDDEEEEEEDPDATHFINYYECPNCSKKWHDPSPCQTDDDCGGCGTTCSPYLSEDA